LLGVHSSHRPCGAQGLKQGQASGVGQCLRVFHPPCPSIPPSTSASTSATPPPAGGRPRLPQRHPAQRGAHQRGGAQARPRLPPVHRRHTAGGGGAGAGPCLRLGPALAACVSVRQVAAPLSGGP
jgi:hypothetical protein